MVRRWSHPMHTGGSSPFDFDEDHYHELCLTPTSTERRCPSLSDALTRRYKTKLPVSKAKKDDTLQIWCDSWGAPCLLPQPAYSHESTRSPGGAWSQRQRWWHRLERRPAFLSHIDWRYKPTAWRNTNITIFCNVVILSGSTFFVYVSELQLV